jgi:hypothetical protein
MRVRRADGTEAEIALKEGAIDPLFAEVGSLPWGARAVGLPPRRGVE